MTPEQYQKRYIENHLQFIELDTAGSVLQSTGRILPIEKGQILSEVHPFFESLEPELSALDAPQSLHCVNLDLNGREIIVDIHIHPADKGFILLVQDLTSHYTSYQEVAQERNESVIQEELIVLKNAELEERERFKNLFIQNFSHELRNPLMSSMAITRILSESPLNTEQQNLIEALRETNTHLKLMLEDTLSLSMIASGKLELKPVLFDLAKMLDVLSITYKTKADSKGLDFELSSHERVPQWVEADRKRLFQVLTNLLDNAVKFTEQGKITLEVGFNQQYANKVNLHFAVTDTGKGIPEAKKNTVFETYSQLTSPEKEQGTGLGLALVKGLLTLMGSEIRLQSKEGKGSVFSFDLEVKVPVESGWKATLEKDADRVRQKTAVRGRKYRILLVEDDERVLTVLFKMLMETGQFYLDVLSDGAQVLEQVIENPYDLILMDINLPNTRGDQLTRIIREFPFKNVERLPIIGITAFAYEDHLKAYKASGMNAVIPKPFEKEELLDTIFSCLKS